MIPRQLENQHANPRFVILNKELDEWWQTFNMHRDLFVVLKIQYHIIFVICIIFIKIQ